MSSYICQIIILYFLYIYSAVCQSYLSKIVKKIFFKYFHFVSLIFVVFFLADSHWVCHFPDILHNFVSIKYCYFLSFFFFLFFLGDHETWTFFCEKPLNCRFETGFPVLLWLLSDSQGHCKPKITVNVLVSSHFSSLTSTVNFCGWELSGEACWFF